MSLSLKTSFLFAAVAISIFSAFVIIAQTPLYKDLILPVDKHFVVSYACTSLLLVSMLLLIGLTQAKQKIARATGIPMTKQGLERIIGIIILKGARN